MRYKEEKVIDEFWTYVSEQNDIYLNSKGIDTVCIMGYGYSIEDVRVGATFYLSYLFWCRDAKVDHNTQENVLKSCLSQQNSLYPNIRIEDKFKLLCKYRYMDRHQIINFKIHKRRVREEFVQIKNLRTGEVKTLNDEWIDMFHLFNFDIW